MSATAEQYCEQATATSSATLPATTAASMPLSAATLPATTAASMPSAALTPTTLPATTAASAVEHPTVASSGSLPKSAGTPPGQLLQEMAHQAVATFAAWFREADVFAHESLACFEEASRSRGDFQVDLCLQLDCEDLDHEVDVLPMLSRRLAPGGLLLRLSNTGDLGRERRVGRGSASGKFFWQRLHDGGAEGDAWQRGLGSEPPWLRLGDFEAPRLEPSRLEFLRWFLEVSPCERARARGHRAFLVEALGIPKGIVAIRQDPSFEGRVVGHRCRNDVVVASQSDKDWPWVQLSSEDDWLAEMKELRRLEGEDPSFAAWMLTDGAAVGFGTLLSLICLDDSGCGTKK
ncbi:unnamed protein product, partial [Polarella glacialis]